jgi:hypothetical protein
MSNEKLLAALPLAALCAAIVLPLPHAVAAGQDGMVVVRDPQTGQMRAPTAAELKALGPAPMASLHATAPLASLVVTRPDGSRLLRLGEKGMVYSVATRGADGKLVERCVKGEHAAGALAQAAPTARQNEEHRHEDR